MKAFAHVPSTLPSYQPKYIAYTFLAQRYPLSNAKQQKENLARITMETQ
jgi:hypothetical protein